MNHLQLTSKQKLIERIMAILAGDLPPSRHRIAILWDEEDPANEDNIYMVDSKKVNYEQWTKYNK